MQHMLSHGFTEIATVIGPRFSTASLAREQAFVRTAAAAGITISGDRKISTRGQQRRGTAGGRASLLRPDSTEGRRVRE
jgi:LacI family transcriptional regulator